MSDLEWLHHPTSAFGWAVPGEVKVFGLADLDAAVAWAAG